MRLSVVAAGLLFAACARPATDGGRARASSAASRPDEVIFTGACDASGAVALSEHSFWVADDEDNVLRAYDVTRGGAPVGRLEVSRLLELHTKGKSARYPEADIEAATLIGDRAYFLTSHGRNSSGKLKPERFRFFATESKHGQMKPVGEAYERLLDDLLAEPRLRSFELEQAAELAPKSPGGLNLEGMTARLEGGVWIGFRNPIPRGRALLLPLLNPEGLIGGQRAEFGEPLTLDLGGFGVRGLSVWRGRYLIAAGPFDSVGVSRLFSWDGRARVQPVQTVDLSNYNPEAFFTPESGERIMLLSDDGSRVLDGTECKRLTDDSKKQFRGLWLTLPPMTTP
jgi:hypothetical protein